MVIILVLIIYNGNNFTFNRPPYLPTLERIPALQEMTEKKKHFFVYLVGSVQQELSPVFTQSKFFLGALKIVPSQSKFEK